MLISTAWAQSGGAAGGGGLMQTIIMMVLIFGVFYFLMIRPQQKKVKAHREMVSALRRGDKVVTAGVSTAPLQKSRMRQKLHLK